MRERYHKLASHMTEQELSVDAYCDGSICASTLEDYHESGVSDNVGRICVIIPALDYGIIERFRDPVALSNSNPSSLVAEMLAIRRADEVCRDKIIRSFRIHSDNPEAIKRVGFPNLEHVPPHLKKSHFPHVLLKRITERAAYLRQSEGVVKKRRPPTPIWLEITRLMSSESTEFKLSESRLYLSLKLEQKFSSNGQLANFTPHKIS